MGGKAQNVWQIQSTAARTRKQTNKNANRPPVDLENKQTTHTQGGADVGNESRNDVNKKTTQK